MLYTDKLRWSPLAFLILLLAGCGGGSSTPMTANGGGGGAGIALPGRSAQPARRPRWRETRP